MININCQHNDSGAWCTCKEVKRSLFGFGARCCIEHPFLRGNKCEYKKPYIRPTAPPPPPKLSMAEKAKASGRSHFRGHPIIWVDDKWLYEDDREPIPGWGGENRPCAKCGSDKWSGDGHVDECLGILPGVSNACCGHGRPEMAYICFTSGITVIGFKVEDD